MHCRCLPAPWAGCAPGRAAGVARAVEPSERHGGTSRPSEPLLIQQSGTQSNGSVWHAPNQEASSRAMAAGAEEQWPSGLSDCLADAVTAELHHAVNNCGGGEHRESPSLRYLTYRAPWACVYVMMRRDDCCISSSRSIKASINHLATVLSALAVSDVSVALADRLATALLCTSATLSESIATHRHPQITMSLIIRI